QAGGLAHAASGPRAVREAAHDGGRHRSAHRAPGEPAHQRGGAEGARAARRPRVQQHPEVREHDGCDDPHRLRRMPQERPHPARATQRYAVATTASLVLVAVLSPFVGAIADVRPVKKRMLASFMALGVFASASLFFVSRGDSLLGTALLVLVNVGLNGSFVFYDALLPHVAREDELDRVSAAGYAIGYLGGGLLLAVQLVLILYPALLGLPAGAAATPAH